MNATEVRPAGRAGAAGRRADPVIDCDLHTTQRSVRDLFPYLSREWREHIETYGVRKYAGTSYPRFWGETRLPRPLPPAEETTMVALMSTGHLDRYGIAYGILNPLTAVGGTPHLDLEVALATAVNDWQAAEWLDPEPRLLASIVVPFEQADRAVAEIDRRAGDRRFVQVQFTGRPHEPMGRRRYWPIYEACEYHGLPVMTHAFGSGGHPITGAGWASYYIEDHAGPPQAVQANIISMIAEGVFDRFPALKFVSVENGFGWVPSLMWRLDEAWQLLRSEVPHVKRLPSEYVAEHVYLSTQPVEEPPTRRQLEQFLRQFPQYGERLVFASDYPHWDADSPDRALPAVLPRQVRSDILYENARRLYRLP